MILRVQENKDIELFKEEIRLFRHNDITIVRNSFYESSTDILCFDLCSIHFNIYFVHLYLYLFGIEYFLYSCLFVYFRVIAQRMFEMITNFVHYF